MDATILLSASYREEAFGAALLYGAHEPYAHPRTGSHRPMKVARYPTAMTRETVPEALAAVA